jgi:hypothetical protein
MRSCSRSIHQPERRRLIAARSSASVDCDGGAGLREAAFFAAFFAGAFFAGFFAAFFTAFFAVFALFCFAISVFPPDELINARAILTQRRRFGMLILDFRFWILD